ncbi:FAD-containing monooxygenase EthA [Penicillium rolfsii]|nr:FAD-containing monooxygenase EthA [Penicillium rolfsii]
MDRKQEGLDYDVVIIGAGISGINFAYRLQERNPDLSYCIVEERHEIGGTWSLFQYPGIRSDSDLFTFGFAWRPWAEKNSIAHGSLIAKYVRECAEEEGIDKKIKFKHRVNQLAWSTESKAWTLDLTANETSSSTLRSRFVLLATGYYDYHEPLQADIPGIQHFAGTLVHPQFWPEDLDLEDKKVVIIGYILSVPNEDLAEKVIRLLFPKMLARKIIRLKWIVMPLIMVTFCRRFPRLARKLLLFLTAKELPKDMPLDPNFTPRYNPWEQRLCMCPESDFYRSIQTGKASIKTDVIQNINETSIQLQSGDELQPDIIVTATGLKLQIAGGIEILVDGKQFNIGDHFLWKFAMMDGLPNAIFAFGYVDASWTLGADATAKLACRMLKKMKRDGITMVVPRMDDRERLDIKKVPFLDLKSTYVQQAQNMLPAVGDRSVWQRRSFYWRDLAVAVYGNLKKGTVWTK